MNSDPVLIRSQEDDGIPLKKIETTPGGPRNEEWLQELLYHHPEILPIDEFDETFAPAIPIGREVRCGSGLIDNLYISPSGCITIVETKLWKNPESHREVVAQILDYATKLSKWNYNDLADAVQNASRSQDATVISLEKRVETKLKEQAVDLSQFQECVLENLARGNFLLLIVGDRISPNVAMMTKAIHGAPGLEFQFGLVEMRLYPIEAGKDWPLVVVPDVVGRTVEKLRAVVRIRYEEKQKKPEAIVEFEDDPKLPASGKLDLEAFLHEVSKNKEEFVMLYREAIAKWQKLGGTLDCTDRMINFTMMLNGECHRVIRCMTFQVQVVTREKCLSWFTDALLYEHYLERLDNSETIGKLARGGAHWVSYRKINAGDLRAILDAGMILAQSIQKAEENQN